ncbi:hypothetical protein G6F68_017015 [Rhizopus microsporus]|nr:hypothetical protein G6F68_017015 [Rhizopus microsporus]
MDQPLFALVHAADADLADPARFDVWRLAGHARDLLGTVAAQAGHGHAVDIAGGGQRVGIEIGMGWRATALIEPMPRQWSPPSSTGRRPSASSAYTASCTARFHAATSSRWR